MANQDLGELRKQLLKARFGDEEKPEELLELEKRIVIEGFRTISEKGIEVLMTDSLLACQQVLSGKKAEDNIVYLFIANSGFVDILPLLKYASKKTRREYARIKYSLR